MANKYNLGPFRLRPRGAFNPEVEYRYLDTVKYNGSSYWCINYDTIDGVACIGIPPIGSPQSAAYWDVLAEKGDKGDLSDQYQSFMTVTNGAWNYANTDKIFIPENGRNTISISNPYDGCCGIIITRLDLVLPSNSLRKVDYDYVDLDYDDDMYLYTFVYGNFGGGYKFVWSRSIINE